MCINSCANIGDIMINTTYQTATSFSMFIPGSEYAGLQMKVVEFKIPQVQSPAVEQGTRRLMAKHAGSNRVFAPLSVNVIADGGLTNITPVHDWLVNNVITNEPETKDIRLIGYAANNTQLFTVDFKNAFPTDINIDGFSSQDASDQIIKAQIEFNYDYYTYG